MRIFNLSALNIYLPDINDHNHNDQTARESNSILSTTEGMNQRALTTRPRRIFSEQNNGKVLVNQLNDGWEILNAL